MKVLKMLQGSGRPPLLSHLRPRSLRPLVDLVLDMVIEDRRLPTRPIVDRLGSSQERASNILTVELGSRRVSTRWVACLLSVLSQERMRTRQTIIWNFLKLIQMTFWHDS